MKKIVSIIIPSYNEALYLKKLINKINNLKFESIGFDYEIIIIDDGSTDNTKEIISSIKNIKYVYQKNYGKGNAVQTGIKISKGEYILIQDADLEYDPNDYYKLLEPFKTKSKISVFGSRPMKINNGTILFNDKHTKQNYSSYIMNKLLCVMFRFLFKVKLTDPLTGYKVYEKKFFLNNVIESNGFEADHEITIKLLKSNYKIFEVPINYNPRTIKEGKKINFSDALKALFILIKFRIIF